MKAGSSQTSIGDLMASLVHELNNPLAAILGFAQLAANQSDPTRRQEMFETIRAQSAECKSILQRVEDAYVIPEVRLKEIEIQLLFDQVAFLGNQSPAVSDIPVELQVEAGATSFFADKSLVVRALSKLVDNAVLAVAAVAQPRITLSATVSDTHTVIAVSDNGPGIAAAHLAQVFEPTFTTRSGGRGLGLGLVAVRNVLDAHHGTVELVNLENGLRVELWFRR